MAAAAELRAAKPRSKDFALCMASVLPGARSIVAKKSANTEAITPNSFILLANSDAENSRALSNGFPRFINPPLVRGKLQA